METSLSEAYPFNSLEEVRSRYRRVRDAFSNKFGGVFPDFYSRAPGRVNLIGEHIDYEGYGVLPIGLHDRDVITAIVAPLNSSTTTFTDKLKVDFGKDKLCLLVSHFDSHFDGFDDVVALCFDRESGEFDSSSSSSFPSSSWIRYIAALIPRILKTFKLKSKSEYSVEKTAYPEGKKKNFSLMNSVAIMVQGTIPLGSGLSSSAGLLCSLALAVSTAFGMNFSREELASITKLAENDTGLMCGGMDHAVSMLATASNAQFVNFCPITSRDVSLPDSVAFVVANSCSIAVKNDRIKREYNTRVVECQLAAWMLGMEMNLSKWGECKTLSEIEAKISESKKGHDFREAIMRILEPGLHDVNEMTYLLEPNADVPSLVAKHNVQGIEFNIRSRAFHVFEERDRVLEFIRICECEEIEKDDIPELLGNVLNRGHASLRDKYEISNADIEDLVSIGRKKGHALGGRITGAGFGGCVIFLVRNNATSIAELINALDADYYAKRRLLQNDKKLDDLCFLVHPGAGASVIQESEVV